MSNFTSGLYVNTMGYLSMKAWCNRNMGSLAEPWTLDMEPFIKTCRELCMVLWPGTAWPVSGLANPAGDKQIGGTQSQI